MILRKPYAFLIRHFRLIHLVLFGLLVYVCIYANSILKFFKRYISANGNIEVIASDYINSFIIVCFLFVIILSVIIYLLMRYKKKPKFLYVLVVIVSLISSLLCVYLYNNILVLETSNMSAKNIRFLRDISSFNYWGLFILCIPILIRGLGFDIKKFNFSKDLMELKLDKTDNEEVEVNIDLSYNGIKRSGHKIGRELKYYYLENKFILNIIFVIIGIVLIVVFPFNKYVVNATLGEGDVLGTKDYNIIINNSYISDRKRVSKNCFYLILDVSIKGKSENYKIKLDNLVLKTGNNSYIPSLKYYYYFSDLGKGYYNDILANDEYVNYIFIYNIDNDDKNADFSVYFLENDRSIDISPKVIS